MQESFDELSEGLDAVGRLLEARGLTLTSRLEAAARSDDERLEFADVARDLMFVLEAIEDELTQPVFCRSAAEVQWMQASVQP